MKIGVVLAGGMSKGFYEIGCLNAIFDFFGKENIECISASSIGALTAYAGVTGQNEYLINALKDIDVRKSGSFFPPLSGKADLIQKISAPNVYYRMELYREKGRVCPTA